MHQDRWSQQPGQDHLTVRHRGGGHKRQLPLDRLQAQQGRRRLPRLIRFNTIRIATARVALLHSTLTARSDTSSLPAGLNQLATPIDERSRMPRRQLATACRWRSIPLSTQMVHNIEMQAWLRRRALPQCRHATRPSWPAKLVGLRSRSPAAKFAVVPVRLPGDDWHATSNGDQLRTW